MAVVPVYLNDRLNTQVAVHTTSILLFLAQIKIAINNNGSRFDIYLDIEMSRSVSVGSFYPDSFIPSLFNSHNAHDITAVNLYNNCVDARPS